MKTYLILSNSRNIPGEFLAFADRSICKDQFWTQVPAKMKVFPSLEAAQIQLSKLKYNNPQVVGYQKGIEKIHKANKAVQNKSFDELLKHLDWLEMREDSGFGSWDHGEFK